MVPGGVTETIWHFAGYFRHIEEVMKDRFVYEHGGAHMRPDDYVNQLKDFLSKHDLDEFDTDRIPFVHPEFPADQSDPFPARDSRPLPDIGETDAEADPVRGVTPKKFLPLIDGPLGVAPGTLTISVNYQNGGDQLLLDIEQINRMEDDDLLGMLPGSAAANLHPFDIDSALEDLIAGSQENVPEDLAFAQSGTAELLEFVVARDTELAGNGDTNLPDVGPGRYLNGVLQADPAPPELPEEATPELDRSLKGQWGMLGGNEATNAALIVDMKEGSNTMIVLGDFFKSNVIVQGNSYIDNDDVHHSSLLPGDAVSGGSNTADNIAELQQHAGVFPQGLFAGFNWNVDVVEGHFYDINMVVQYNFLRDNDVVFQDTNHTHYEAHVGENEQINLTQVTNGEIKYDLIIIGGDYHGANWIFQNNILLDPDILKVAASGDAAAVTDQSIAAGGNTLLNEAQIITYGDNIFAAPTESMQSVVTAIAEEQSSLDPEYGWFVPGNGSGTLNVLYVSGDYYDINAIWQTNIISDADTGMQVMGEALPENATGDGTLTQSLSTGGNSAINDAAIVDVGAMSTFVTGEVYQDTILIQGNLVAEDDDKITYGDPAALVSEIVAFTSEECPPEEVTDIRAPIVPDDTLGSILT